MTADPRLVEGDNGPELLSLVDLALGEGSPAAREALRRDVEVEPVLAIELAEIIALLEQARLARIEPSPRFAAQLAALVRRAVRSAPTSRRRPRHLPLVGLLAAALTFAALWWLDPLRGGSRRAAPAPHTALQIANAGAERETAVGAALEQPLGVGEFAWRTRMDVVRRRIEIEGSPQLRLAFEDGLVPAADPLAQWLQPRNALARARLDHQLRALPEVRAAAGRNQRALLAADERAQVLANDIARDLVDRLAIGASTPQEVAMGLRALVAAGPGPVREQALERGSAWLAAQLPGLRGEPLVAALAGLMDAAVAGDQHLDEVLQGGRRLVDEILLPDDDNWTRRLPALLHRGVQAAVLGETARLMARLPGVGVEPQHCALVRRLVLGKLRERRTAGQDRPEVLAAILYGAGDLLPEPERDQLEDDLRRWRPIHLVPDYKTVLQIAWGVEPFRRGFARTQGELRQFAALPLPASLEHRAAFCMCLTTAYAGFGGDWVQRLVHGG